MEQSPEKILKKSFISQGSGIEFIDPTRVSTDSREISPGDLFVPIVGDKFDGHDFISHVISKGAASFLSNDDCWKKLDKNIKKSGIEVTDTLLAYQEIARYWRKRNNIKLAAVTGSSGKTTVKELVSCILSESGPYLATEGSFNNEIGVPKTLLKIEPQHQAGILEFGARHEKDIEFLVELAQPNVCCILNIGNAHLGEFGSIEKLRKTKLEMINYAGPEATIIYLNDDPLIRDTARALTNRAISFGTENGANVKVTGKNQTELGMDIDLSYQSTELNLSMKTSHTSLPINCAAAAAIALALGIELNFIKKGLEKFEPPEGRFSIHRLNNKMIVDDAYNANPESMRSGMNSLHEHFPDAKKVLVLGDMLELGETSKSEHEKIGKIALELNPLAIYTVGKESSWISNYARSNNKITVEHYSNCSSLLAEIDNILASGDLFYVKGSNSIKLKDFVNKAVEKLK